MTGIEALLEVLTASGVRYVFGNPGTTELPLIDALVDHKRIEYILALQEVPAMAMAEGYAQASQTPAVVNLHICCGLGNAMGMLYNAYRSGSPLIVTAGQQDQRLSFEEPILWGDMVNVARPWTKWSAEVHRAEDVPNAVRRALQVSMTPPSGPVFLSLPLDVQTAEAQFDLGPATSIDAHVRPAQDAVRRAAQVLAAAHRPVILVGSRAVEVGAVAELVAVAERLGAPVIQEATSSHGRCSFPSDHPLAAEPLPFWSPEVRDRLAEFDVVLAVGIKLFQQYIYHEPSRPLPEQVRLVQVDDSAWELGKNYPAAAAVLGHLKPALADLATELDAVLTPAARATIKTRGAAWAAEHADQREALRRQAREELPHRPLSSLAFMEGIARVLPDNVAVVEESPTTTGGYLERSGVLRNADGYFGHRGWALGWGLNCAIGVQLAWPDRPVLALLGDGSTMYGVQGLWTAARYRLPVTFVVANNTEYRILKECARVLHLPAALAGRYVGLDVSGPAIDYVGLSQSLGVPARRVTDPDELSAAVRQSLAARTPQLIEVPLRR
jgi:benzoylformate decarboxylase